jgi:ATP-dependent helicase YprA (DUF1998 family)
MEEQGSEQQERKVKVVFDENPNIIDNDSLPVLAPLKVLRYKTIKKNNALGWWSAVVLLEDHGNKQVCFYRWRRKKKSAEWKRDKKLPFRTRAEWIIVKEMIDSFITELS